MKTLIVYYSMDGNTELAARSIARATESETLRLRPVREYNNHGLSKYIWGGKSAMMKEKPALESYEADLGGFDRIIIGFPVWAGTFAPPIRTFIEENREALKGKTIDAFACQSGRGAEKAFGKLEEFMGVKLGHTAVFIDPKFEPTAETRAAIEAFGEELK